MRRRVGPALSAVAVVLAVVFPSLPAAAEDPPSGTPLSVNVTDGSTATPAPTPRPSGSDSPSAVVPVTGPAARPGGSTGSTGSAGGSGVGTAPAGGAGAGSPTGSTPPADEVNVAGMLYIGGINAAGTPALNPAEGTVTVWFTVRNASQSVIDATASFWMDGAIFTNRLDTVDDVPVAALQPGETRVVSAELQHGGQWTLLSTHATLTPPDSVDGTALTPVTRDALVILFPWLIVVVAVLLLLTFVLVRVLRSVLAPAPAPAAAA
ncbi:hypothetical protein SRABI128_01895 [Microbacterium sp. Bi128]|nr:hypothetical protein SRABI128_01895 [Microbacterium sp. Bi128]